MTTVAHALVASAWRTTTQRLPPISSTPMLLTKPSSSACGGSSLMSAVAATVRQKRRSSNLEGILSTSIPCFSKKCIAISPTLCPVTTTRAPVSAIALIASAIFASSPSA